MKKVKILYYIVYIISLITSLYIWGSNDYQSRIIFFNEILLIIILVYGIVLIKEHIINIHSFLIIGITSLFLLYYNTFSLLFSISIDAGTFHAT